MAQRRNPINSIVNSSAGQVNIFTNPSLTGFSYVYKLAITANQATNLTPQMITQTGQYVSLAGAFDLTAGGSAITFEDSANPWYTLDPNSVFSLNNSTGANIQGQVLWSV